MIENKILSVMLVMVVMIGIVSATGAVNLGTADAYTILAKSAITSSGTTVVDGDVALNGSSSSIVGFTLTVDTPLNQTASSPIVTGKVHASNYAAPTPALIANATIDMDAAYTDLANRTADVSKGIAEDISGQTFTPGVYSWTGGVSTAVDSEVILAGGPSDIFVFRSAGSISTGARSHITLVGGATYNNIYWVDTGSAVTLGANSTFRGNILSNGYTTLGDHAQIQGKIFSRTAVTLDGNTVASAITETSPLTTPAVGSTDTGGFFNPNAATGGVDNRSMVQKLMDWLNQNFFGIPLYAILAILVIAFAYLTGGKKKK